MVKKIQSNNNGTYNSQKSTRSQNSEPKEKKQLKNEKSPLVASLGIILQILWPPIAMIGFRLICNETQCTFFAIPDLSQFDSLSNFLDLETFLVFSSYAIFLALLGMLPFGGEKVKSFIKNDDFVYVTNGFATMMVSVFCFVVLECFQIPISKFIVQHMSAIIVSNIIFCSILSVIVYIKSFFAPKKALNPEEINSSILSAFFNGREMNTRIGILDIKVYMTRLYAISLIIIDLAFLISGLNLNLVTIIKTLDWTPFVSHPTFSVITAFHISYFMCHLYYENRLMTSHFVRSEGLGYNIVVGIFVWWSGLIAQTSYILFYQVNYPTWQLIVLSLIHCFGLVYYQISNNEKDAFRKDPTSSPHFKSIKTNVKGKDILCSGTWGIVRQPNITTDILVHLSWLRFGWHAPPAIGVIALINMFYERSIASQEDCKRRYGEAWNKYCKKVKYILVPYVY